MARKQVITFSLDTEADRDIIRWIERLPRSKRSEAIRGAIRDHIGLNGVTLGDVFRAVRELEHTIRSGIVVVQGDDDRSLEVQGDEPPEAAAALDALANL